MMNNRSMPCKKQTGSNVAGCGGGIVALRFRNRSSCAGSPGWLQALLTISSMRQQQGTKPSTAALLAAALLLSGCVSSPPQYSAAAKSKQTGTGVTIRPSDIGAPKTASVEYIRIRTEKSIFLDPPEDNTDVYLRVGDTSGRDWGGVQIRDLVAQELGNRGYNVVANSKNAAYSLQVNILLADEASAAEIAQLDETKYGQDISSIAKSALAGAAVGGIGSGIAGGGDPNAILIGAAGGAVIGGGLNALSKSRKKTLLAAQQQTKFFSFITDVEIRERAQGTVQRSGNTNLSDSQNATSSDLLAGVSIGSSQSGSITETETYEETSTWKRHRSRVIGKEKGKLVVFEDVQIDFATKMARAIAGFF